MTKINTTGLFGSKDERDIDPFAPEVPKAVESNKTSILCFDLGTSTGWAVRDNAGVLYSGHFNVSIDRKRHHPGQKWANWRAEASRLIERFNPSVIVFEDVKAHGKGGTLAAHAYGGYRAFLEWMAATRNIRIVAIGVTVIKKHWTGKGNANKEAMIAEARIKGFKPETDDEADAMAIRSWAINNLE